MLRRCSEAKILEACWPEFGASFLPFQKATLGTGSCQSKAPSGLQFHGVSVLRGHRLGGLLAGIWILSFQKSAWAQAVASRRPRHPLVSWCYGAVKPRFWRLASWNLELEILVASDSDIRHSQPSVEGFVRTLVPWSFGAARPRFWRLASWNLELDSSHVRKRR